MSQSRSDPLEKSQAVSLAALILELHEESLATGELTLGHAIDRTGARIHGAAILLLALPEAIPIPLPSIGAVLGIPLLVISMHLALYGERSDLPPRARQVPLPPRMLGVMARYLVGPLRQVERFSHNRMPTLARRERAVGMACVLMSALLLMPVPLMNVPPAMVMVCLAWGLVQQDGLIVGAGFAMAAGVIVTIASLGNMIATALAGIGG